MKICSITPFKGEVNFINPNLSERNYSFCLRAFDPQYNQDQLIHGFSAKDESGNRVDPKNIRQKTDGSFWLVEFE